MACFSEFVERILCKNVRVAECGLSKVVEELSGLMVECG